jgi:predicted RNA-binding Zn-ribbon protein involved in translation (DUF1610 family)
MKKVRALIKKDPLFEKCPSCKSPGTLRKSHSRNFVEKVVNHLTIYNTYRCKKCGWRGYLKTLSITTSTLTAILVYIGIIIGSAFITYQIIKRIL